MDMGGYCWLARAASKRVARTSSGSGTPRAAGGDHSGDGIASRADQHLKCAVSSRSAAEMTRQRRASLPRSAAEMIVPLPIGRRAFRRDLPAYRATDGGERARLRLDRQQQSGRRFELVSRRVMGGCYSRTG